MDSVKWLRRKYPNSFDILVEFLEEGLENFKKGKYKVGRLKEDSHPYKKGDLCMFKYANPINDYNYPLTPAHFKYNSVWVPNSCIVEIKK